MQPFDGVEAWASAALPETVQVIWADQNAHRPDGNFVTLKISNLMRINTVKAYQQAPNNDDVVNIFHHYDITCSVNSYGNGALAIAQKLVNSADLFLIQQVLHDNDLVFLGEMGSLNNLTALSGAQFEPRIQFDARFRYATCDQDKVEIIERVIASGKITKDDDTIILSAIDVSNQGS